MYNRPYQDHVTFSESAVKSRRFETIKIDNATQMNNAVTGCIGPVGHLLQLFGTFSVDLDSVV